MSLAGSAPAPAEQARPGAVASLVLAVLLVLVPASTALATSLLPAPTPAASEQEQPATGEALRDLTAPNGTDDDGGAPSGAAGPTAPTTATATNAASCPDGLFGWLGSPTALDDCLAGTLATSTAWLFQESVTAVTSWVAFNPLRGNYWEVYLWHFALLSVVALVVAVVQWLVTLVAGGAVEGVKAAGRSFLLLVLGLPMAFSVPFFVLLVDAGVLAVTGAFAGVFAARVTELGGEISRAVLIGDTPGSLLAALLMCAFLFPLLLVIVFTFVIRQIAVYAVPVFGQFGLLPALAGDGGAALRSYFRIMTTALLFPLQFVALLVIGVSFLDFSSLGDGFVTLLYIAGVLLFALIGGSFLSLVFGASAGRAAVAVGNRRRRNGRPMVLLSGRGRVARAERGSRVEGTRVGALAADRWDRRRAAREARRSEREARRTPASPLYWLGPAASPSSSEPSKPSSAASTAQRTHGDRARERRGRRVGGASSPPSARGRSRRGPRS